MIHIVFRLKERVKFLWQAKNAHGLHSPYVFIFYNTVKTWAKSFKFQAKKTKNFNKKQSRILLAIVQYLNPKKVLIVSNEEENISDWKSNFLVETHNVSIENINILLNKPVKFDLIILPKSLLINKEELLSSLLPFISTESVVIIPHIYASKEAITQWKSLIKENSVRMSIDLFFIGLLFFRKELTRQNFRLRF